MLIYDIYVCDMSFSEVKITQKQHTDKKILMERKKF